MLALLSAPHEANALAENDAIYTVRGGDNLSVIASRIGVTLGDLRRANGIRGDLIRPGQKLKVPRPLRRLTRASLNWRRPQTSGRAIVIRDFGPRRNSLGVTVPNTGVDLAVPRGTRIVAPATGVVRYAGEQEGYGFLLIIEHAAGYTSVLGPFDPAALKVRLDDLVLRGDALGKTGAPLEGEKPYLHVELRRNGKAVRPDPLLR